MSAAIIAVVGTLAGVLITGLIQARIATAARTAARADDHRREAIAAVTELAVALSDHRTAMYKVGQARFVGTDDARLQELRDASHATRSAITAPAVRVQLLAPGLHDAAVTATLATYAMRHPATEVALDDSRRHALATHDELVYSASRALAA
ncbi:pRL2-23 [Streptomyces anulatus]|uniref:pRL2-23 n=1 Tax=Streptomyces anulatus TaxID=1892 RepID=UPI0033C826DE